MPDPRLLAALDAGAVLITPNNRLAREAVQRFDAANRAAGRLAWPSARALPLQAWLRALWTDAVARGVTAGPTLLSPGVALHLWQQVVESDSVPLLDPRGAARQAADAWEIFHAWREPGESPRAWRQGNRVDDVATFARWCERYQARLRSAHALDDAQLADAVAEVAKRVVSTLDRIVLHGFVELAPAQRRLLTALREAGCVVDEWRIRGPRATTTRRIVAPSEQDEMQAALGWARERAIADPQARIAIVVENLQARREAWTGLADEMLSPEHLVAGSDDPLRPWGVSLGRPLASYRLVSTAMQMIETAIGRIDALAAAELLRSPYLPDAKAQWIVRAEAERIWREQGRHVLSWPDVVRTLATLDRTLAARWQSAATPARAARAPRAWVEAWSVWLGALGWPGGATLDSTEWQLHQAWSDALVEFMRHGQVTTSLDATSALASLRAVLTEQLFQPQAPQPRIQILGVLEAAGMRFDAVWLAGFSADRWPPAPSPNPFLPLSWQRERGLTRATPAGQLEYARQVTALLAAAGDEAIASCARVTRDAEQVISPLFDDWTEDSFATPHARLSQLLARTSRMDRWRDDRAPALPIGTEVRGGTKVLESQSACPFQGFARMRLHAQKWPEADAGLTPMERGNLLHDALARFWSGVPGSTALRQLDAPQLDARIESAVSQAIDQFSRRSASTAKASDWRWRNLPPVIAANEHARMVECVRNWLELERHRPDFTVTATERGTTLKLGELRIALRIDRIDTLPDGGIAILDYKSGAAQPPSQWFRARPAGAQIGLYALAERAGAPTRPVRVVAYAQLKAGDVKAVGLTSDATAWPAVPTFAKVRGVPYASWGALEAGWADLLDGIAREYREGRADVTPRNGEACRHCDLQSLCRIHALAEEAVPHPQEDPDDE